MIKFHHGLVVFAALMSCLTPCLAADSPPDDGILFDGEGALAVSAEDLSLSKQTLSVSAWVNLDDVAQEQVFLNRGHASGNFTFHLFKGRVRMLVRNTPEPYTHANVAAPTAKTWIHYLGTYDGAVIRLYVNGQPAATTDAPGRLNGKPDDLFVGSLNDYERLLKGRMTDIRIWNRALAPEEASAVYAGQTGGPLDDELPGGVERRHDALALHAELRVGHGAELEWPRRDAGTQRGEAAAWNLEDEGVQ